MHIYDIIHGYQPCTNELTKPWVLDNITKTFIPTSNYLVDGEIKQNIQLQGWTISEFLENKKVKKEGIKVIKNLKKSYNSNNITLGASLYNHALMPLLKKELIYALIFLDTKTIEEHIGKPTFFFPPELAIDKESLKVIFDNFPDLIPVIPNLSIKKKSSQQILIKYNKNIYPCYVANIYLKDTLMNGTVYQNISYLPRGFPKKTVRQSMRNYRHFKILLEYLDNSKNKIIPRDWENGESRDALIELKNNKKVIKAFPKLKNQFKLIKNFKSTKIIDINSIIPSSWEPIATFDNPYPYWEPQKTLTKRKIKIKKNWLSLIEIYEKAFFKYFNLTNNYKKNIIILKKELQNTEKLNILKNTSPSLASCIPWHFYARDEWENDIEFAIEMLEIIVKPKIMELTNLVYDKKEAFKILLKINECANNIIE